MRRQGHTYPPIADHALIGNMYTSALVALDGSIVWCCFPELDGGSVFASILDHRKGGRFRIAPAEDTETSQRYVDLTGVLVTRFRTAGGTVTVTDFMPLRGSIHGCEAPEGPPEIHRLVECESGALELEMEWSPRFDYARGRTRIERLEGGFVASCGDELLSLAGVAGATLEETGTGPTVHARTSIRAGDRIAVVTRYGSRVVTASVDQSRRALDRTVDSWHQWMRVEDAKQAFSWAGDHRRLVLRSAVVLKMLSYPRTGAIAAAPTTSLPEEVGGVRNWDYRYSWIRDAAFTVQALLAIGHSREARDFVEFAERAAMDEESGGHVVKIMYDLRGRLAPDEQEVDELEGYRQSRPVRIGNGARLQRQHDAYGELIDCAYELLRRGEKLEPEIHDFIARLADMACEAWQEPDAGIWEFRAEPRHYVYSKVMVWVALDRAVRLAERHGLRGDVERWRRNRDELRSLILRKGYDKDVGAFVMYFGSRDLDAANLRIPLLEFLPCADPRVQGTIDRTLEQLTNDGMVYRYLANDGLPGHEGTFGLCTFWLVEVLALSGRIVEARRIFEGMAARANHVGLYSEEIAPHSGDFLGNFPQAFTHIGLISSLLYLAAAEGNESPMVPDLEGAPSACAPPGPVRAAGRKEVTAQEASE